MIGESKLNKGKIAGIFRRFSPTDVLVIITGLVVGILGGLLVKAGNPPNMGICIACFERDIAGALGLHRVAAVQYLRPEIMGFLLGAWVSALIFGEFRHRGGSSPLIRFLIGVFVMIGALVFLGCPVRTILRLGGGDLNGLTGLFGIASGAFLGVLFIRRGFSLGRSYKNTPITGWIIPGLMVSLLLMAIFQPPFIFASQKGPGAMHAFLLISLGAGLVVGFLGQRSRMCFVGGIRDLFLIRNPHLFNGMMAALIGVLVTNIILGQFQLGFADQPIAHSSHFWNYLAMVVVGLGATLLGGCPFRQLILAGEGNGDAGIVVIGMIAGAALAHNFSLASSAEGVTPGGMIATSVGLAVMLIIGYFMREK